MTFIYDESISFCHLKSEVCSENIDVNILSKYIVMLPL